MFEWVTISMHAQFGLTGGWCVCTIWNICILTPVQMYNEKLELHHQIYRPNAGRMTNQRGVT